MAADLAQFRDRLKVARTYLAGRIAEDDDPSRKIPELGKVGSHQRSPWWGDDVDAAPNNSANRRKSF